MEGLVAQGNDPIDEIDTGPVLDVALIGAARKAEHGKVASDTTLIALATKLGDVQAVPLLQASLAEQKFTEVQTGE